MIRDRPKNAISEYRAYFRFCDAAAIPPYPVTPILKELCILAKKAGGNSTCDNLEREFRQLEASSHEVFANDDGYQKLMQFSQDLGLCATRSTDSRSSSDSSDGEESEDDSRELLQYTFRGLDESLTSHIPNVRRRSRRQPFRRSL